jgi:hypothetical protein
MHGAKARMTYACSSYPRALPVPVGIVRNATFDNRDLGTISGCPTGARASSTATTDADEIKHFSHAGCGVCVRAE